MNTESNKTVVRRFFALFDNGDLDGCTGLLSPDMKAYQGGMPEPLDRDTFKAFGAGFLAAFSQARHSLQQQVGEGDWVATRAVWSAVHTGAFNGLPATGRPISIEAQIFDRVAGGKIIEHRAYFDVAGLMQQIAPVSAAA